MSPFGYRIQKLTDIYLVDTYRPPYYHRNAASELMGLIYGEYGGRSDAFKPGSVSFECGSTSPLSSTTLPLTPPFSLPKTIKIPILTKNHQKKVAPHGVAYTESQEASNTTLPITRISEGSIAFMFESSRPFTITEFAWNSDKKHEHEPRMWDDLVDHFAGWEREEFS